MSENLKAAVAAVVIVACLGLLGFLVHVHAEGAAIAAVAVVTTLVAWVTRAPTPKDPPAGPSIVVCVALGAILSVFVGCAPSKTPREQARSVVLTIADGVRAGDLACASIARAKGDISLAETCAAAVSEARDALLIAEDGVDAWDAEQAGKLPCAAKAATSALSRLLETVRRAGGKTPPAADDALKLAPALIGGCNG